MMAVTFRGVDGCCMLSFCVMRWKKEAIRLHALVCPFYPREITQTEQQCCQLAICPTYLPPQT
eukprot:7425649-Ditylum_brightwellii.AAC.1